MKSPKQDSKFQRTLRSMPALPHSAEGRPFSIADSEVVRWLISQPDIQQWLFDKAKWSGRIIYESGLWRGATPEETEAVLAAWREQKRAK